jgi:hypothetical protein
MARISVACKSFESYWIYESTEEASILVSMRRKMGETP